MDSDDGTYFEGFERDGSQNDKRSGKKGKKCVISILVGLFTVGLNATFYLYVRLYYYTKITLRYMPGFTESGLLTLPHSNMTCDGIFDCAHYICTDHYSYTSVGNNCSMSQNGLIERSGTEHIMELFFIGRILLIVQLLLPPIISLAGYLIIRYPIIISSIQIFIFLGLDFSVKIILLLVLSNLTEIYLDLPLFIFVDEYIDRRMLYSVIGIIAFVENVLNAYLTLPFDKHRGNFSFNMIFDTQDKVPSPLGSESEPLNNSSDERH